MAAVAATRPGERGSAVAEFVMVSTLVLVLGMGVFQLGLVLHVRNTLIACAAEGARLGARADVPTSDASERTGALVTDTLSAAYAQDISTRRTVTDAGVRVVEVTVVAPLPVIGLIGPGGSMTVVGRAFDERQVIEP
ncbi:MAG: pilus assembly protein [Actinomycetales bacterium]|jgi:Flp pilus assembly protein TadG|uniref:Pilus assembly protein n=1 Tax=Candidatus Phosphoribacter hodrii TaxID=2953743 RepID=A0A935CEN4_9MICO|nr:pilus assembly protein [Candidatus Phosphoribacter hodrii]HOA57920.1 pilus assembly protein [Dermatophilaceae bacterium]MBK7273899.1 pilus assembly protein [Candidatus Phosphoribacter hodrii]MBL0004222.1 pilus assembly protein [Candidatus Phosphoribacter hodrii]HOF36895.1 pilus assembly protein [Dermatophilaceae bacterium]